MPQGAVVEITVDGETASVPVKLGVWISNTKSRKDRLDTDQLAAPAKLGMDWAGPPRAIEAAPARPALQPAPPTGPPQRNHHDECDEASYEGGTFTCDLIEEYGPSSERDDY
ncbi:MULTISPECIES: hypothetical protein [Streptomyces griseus group]|uniref:hypothetical protein n=1 Tax=Streptomyces griseus group TaxID=629295 RepID=UPI00367E2023